MGSASCFIRLKFEVSIDLNNYVENMIDTLSYSSLSFSRPCSHQTMENNIGSKHTCDKQECPEGRCHFENCEITSCDGGLCVFVNCNKPSCSGGLCTFTECTHPRCGGGKCEFQDTKVRFSFLCSSR